MRITNKLDQFRSINVWIDEIPYQYKQENMNQFIYKGNQSVKFYEGLITVEAKLNSRHISNYAMISMEYQKRSSQELIVEIINDNTQAELYDSEIHKIGRKFIGIHSEFTEGILNYIGSYNSSNLPSGKIIILGGGYDEIGSSIKAFERVMDILFFIYQELRNNDLSRFNKEVIKKCSFSYDKIINN